MDDALRLNLCKRIEVAGAFARQMEPVSTVVVPAGMELGAPLGHAPPPGLIHEPPPD